MGIKFGTSEFIGFYRSSKTVVKGKNSSYFLELFSDDINLIIVIVQGLQARWVLFHTAT